MPVSHRIASVLAVLVGMVSALPVLSLLAQEGGSSVSAGAMAGRPLAVGDVVSYRVSEDRDPPVQLVVTDSGEIEVPYFGRFRVTGRTPGQAAAAIKAALEQELYFAATVHLSVDQATRQAAATRQVYLSGQVRQPGPVDLRDGETETAGRVLLRAGGLAEFADSRKVKIVRKSPRGGEPENIIVDLKEVLEQGRVDRDVEVRDGDLIIVPQRLFNW